MRGRRSRRRALLALAGLGLAVAACATSGSVVTAPTLAPGDHPPVAAAVAAVASVAPSASSASSDDEAAPPAELEPPPRRRPAVAQGLPPSVPSPPVLAPGTCVWGAPASVPPPSGFAQQLCGGAQHAIFAQQTGAQGASTIPMQLRVLELALDGAPRRDPKTLPMMLYLTARTYAQLECIEADLCAGATATGTAKDAAAAKAARQRMDDLCSELSLVQGAGVKCP